VKGDWQQQQQQQQPSEIEMDLHHPAAPIVPI
jgi:hypothetical protein